MARRGIADLHKVSMIFEAFDVDKDARLNGLELTNLIQQCNPSVCFSVVQLEAIVQEVLQQYGGSESAPGLSRQSLAQLYIDGVADCDIDFHTMQMTNASPARVGDASADTQTSYQAAASNSTDVAAFADLFDHSPGRSKSASQNSRGSFSFCMPLSHNNENTEPNSGDQEQDTATQQAMQEQPIQHITPRRRRGGWGSPQPVPGHPPGDGTQIADHFTPAGVAVGATQATQEHHSHAALVDELALAVDLKDSSSDKTAALIQHANGLEKADCYDSHMEMGTLLASRSQHKEAAKSFQRAVAAAPGDVRPLFRLGNALFAAHQIHDSQEAFQQALACASLPDDAALLPKIHVNLGISLEAGGQLQVACQHYRHAIGLNPNHFRALKLMGSAMYAQGDLQAARTALQTALQLNTAYADAHCDLGCVHCALGEVEEAKKSLADAVHHNPQHVEAMFNLGNLHRQCGEYQAALKCYYSVLKLNDKHWRSMLNKAVALIGLHQDRAAQLSLKQAYQVSGHKDMLAKEVASLCAMAQSGAPPRKLQDLLRQLPGS